jgi:hypothetical protein
MLRGMIAIGSMSAFSGAGGPGPVHPAHPRPVPVRSPPPAQAAAPPATSSPGAPAPTEGQRHPPRILPRGSLLDLSV